MAEDFYEKYYGQLVGSYIHEEGNQAGFAFIEEDV